MTTLLPEIIVYYIFGSNCRRRRHRHRHRHRHRLTSYEA
jgi:hypothetical protein